MKTALLALIISLDSLSAATNDDERMNQLSQDLAKIKQADQSKFNSMNEQLKRSATNTHRQRAYAKRLDSNYFEVAADPRRGSNG
jgi:hypothetical protein